METVGRGYRRAEARALARASSGGCAAGRAVEWALRPDGQLLPGHRRATSSGDFHDSYGLDGTILGLPGGQVHLEIVRLGDARHPAHGLDQLVFYLPDAAAQEGVMARLATAGVHPVAQIDYWEANGGVTYQAWARSSIRGLDL